MYSYGMMAPVASAGSSAWGIIALVLAVVGGFVTYFVFLPAQNEKKFTGFTKWLYDFLSFKTLSLEAILKVCYLILAIFTTLSAFGFIGTSALLFFGTLIVGNLVLRIVFEASLMLIMIYRNTKEINEKTK